MDAYTYFFVLLLSLFLSLAGLYIPLVGLLGVFIAVAVILPYIPTLVADPAYMMFSALVVFGCVASLFFGYRSSGERGRR